MTQSTDFGLEDVLHYITGLRIDDIDNLQSRHALDDTSLSDEELAKFLFAQEAESLLNVTRDHIAGPSGSDAQTLIDELIAMEEMARFDHEYALALSEDRPLPVRPERQPGGRVQDTEFAAYGGSDEEFLSSDEDEASVSGDNEETDSPGRAVEVEEPELVEPDYLERYAELDELDFLGRADRADESLERDDDADERVAIQSVAALECTACGDSIADIGIRALCGHVYDIPCLEIMFRKATTDESLFPPSCCQVSIPITAVEDLLDPVLLSLFEQKSVEFSTPDRVYCSRPTCSTFLGPASSKISSVYCLNCTSTTCGLCKEESHVGRPCAADEVNANILDMAKREGWQRCYSCKHLVELNHGCFHMTCVCKAQFCYLCAEPWKTCACPQFEEERL